MFILYHNFPILLVSKYYEYYFSWYLWMTTVCLSYHQISSVHSFFLTHKQSFHRHYLSLLPLNKLLEVEQLDERTWALLKSLIHNVKLPKKTKKGKNFPIIFQQYIEDSTFLNVWYLSNKSNANSICEKLARIKNWIFSVDFPLYSTLNIQFLIVTNLS